MRRPTARKTTTIPRLTVHRGSEYIISRATAELPTAMWKNSQQEFIIFSHPKTPFTSNTRMELMAGKYEMESGNTRIFIDNLYVLRLKWYDFEDLFGKLPWVQNAPRH